MRLEEQRLLREAVTFQPTLYRMIDGLSTSQDLERFVKNQTSVVKKGMADMLTQSMELNRQQVENLSEIIQQDGKKREEFISEISRTMSTEILDFSKTMSEKISDLEDLRDELENRMMKIIITVGLTSVGLSALLFMVLQQLLT